MLAGRMWQTFAQQLHYLSTLSVSVSSSLAHPLAWLAESLSSGGGDHSKPIASKLMAAAAFLELGVAIQLEGQRSVGDSASDFVKVSLLVRAMLDQVKQLDVSHGQDTVAQLEHVPSKQLLITISHLLDYARASGSTAIGTLLVDGVQRCCSLVSISIPVAVAVTRTGQCQKACLSLCSQGVAGGSCQQTRHAGAVVSGVVQSSSESMLCCWVGLLMLAGYGFRLQRFVDPEISQCRS